MAGTQADIQLRIKTTGERQLLKVEESVARIDQLAQQASKSLNLAAPGRFKGADQIRTAFKQITDLGRGIINNSVQLSRTMEGAAGQAEAFETALRNVNLKSGGLKSQSGTVQNLAEAWAIANQQATKYADQLNRIQQQAVLKTTGTKVLGPFSDLEGLEERAQKLDFYARREAAFNRKLRQLRLERLREQKREGNELRRNLKEGLLSGVGFPLLFGQGAGGIAGGALGAVLSPGGIGGQILGSALGNVFDQSAEAARSFAVALRDTGDGTAYLDQQLGYVNPRAKRFIQNLAESGQRAEAAKLSVEELANAVGPVYAREIVEAGKRTEAFNQQWKRFITSLQGRVSALLNQLAALDEAYQRTFRGRGNQDLRLLEPPAETSGEKQIRERVEDAQLENKVLAERQALVVANAAEDSEGIAIIKRRIAVQEAANEAVNLEREFLDKKITQLEYELRLKGLNLNLETQLLELNRQQALAQERRLNAQIGYEAALIGQTVQELQFLQKRVDLEKGLLSGYGQSLELIRRTALQKEFQLEAERQIKLNSEEGRRNAAAINEIFDRRIQLVRNEATLSEQLLYNARQRAAAEKKINEARRRNGFEDQLRDIARSAPASRNGAEQLVFDQQTRRDNAVNPLLRRAKDLSTLLSSTTNKDEVAELNLELNQTELQLAKVIDALDLLDQKEIAWQRQTKAVELLQQQLNQVGVKLADSFGDILVTALDAALDKTKSLAEEMANLGAAILKAIGQMLILNAVKMGISGLAGSDGKGFFSMLDGSLKPRALGGPVDMGSAYLVGERGPELFIPGTGGFVANTDDTFAASRAALQGNTPGGTEAFSENDAALATSTSLIRERVLERERQAGLSSGSSTIEFSTFRVGEMDVVSREDAIAIGRDAAAKARAQVFSDMRHKPSTRSQLGLR